VKFNTPALHLEYVSLGLTRDKLTGKEATALYPPVQGAGWSLLAGVPKNTTFEYIGVWLSNQAKSATVTGKDAPATWTPGKSWLTRVDTKLGDIGYEHFSFTKGRLDIQLSVRNYADQVTDAHITIDLARRAFQFRDPRTRPIVSVAVLPDGHALAMPGRNTPESWGPLRQSTDQDSRELADEEVELPKWGSPRIHHAELSPDGSLLASVGEGSGWTLRRVGDDDTYRDHDGADEVVKVAFSPSGDRAVTASSTGTVVLHDTSSDSPGQTLARASNSKRIVGLACAEHGRAVSALIADGVRFSLTVWSPLSSAPRKLQSLAIPLAHALSAYGSTAAVIGQLTTASGSRGATAQSSLQLFDVRPSAVADSSPSATFAFNDELPQSVAFAECGRHLAVGTSAGTLMIFEILDRGLRLMGTLPAPRAGILDGDNPVSCLRFSRDESRLVAGTERGHVTVWELPVNSWDH